MIKLINFLIYNKILLTYIYQTFFQSKNAKTFSLNINIQFYRYEND